MFLLLVINPWNQIYFFIKMDSSVKDGFITHINHEHLDYLSCFIDH
jgi:hypothetical protein